MEFNDRDGLVRWHWEASKCFAFIGPKWSCQRTHGTILLSALVFCSFCHANSGNANPLSDHKKWAGLKERTGASLWSCIHNVCQTWKWMLQDNWKNKQSRIVVLLSFQFQLNIAVRTKWLNCLKTCCRWEYNQANRTTLASIPLACACLLVQWSTDLLTGDTAKWNGTLELYS